MSNLWRTVCVATGLLMTVSPAQAYIGPGMGVGTLGVVAGLVSSVFLALFAVIWYPIKRMIKRRTSQPAAARSSAAAHEAAAAREAAAGVEGRQASD